jgi:hypothetical protein
MNVRAAKAGLSIQEIPSHEHVRLHGISNLKVMRDGIRIAKFIVRERFLDGTRRASLRDTSSANDRQSMMTFPADEAEQPVGAAADATFL